LLKKIASKASDAELKEMLPASQDGIEHHTGILKELIEGQDVKVSKEHCKGMEGLVTEATKHVVEEGPKKGPLLDAVIIAQYQRMTHYGIAGSVPQPPTPRRLASRTMPKSSGPQSRRFTAATNMARSLATL
jgi:ferritin-like metal-binding protein YciE